MGDETARATGFHEILGGVDQQEGHAERISDLKVQWASNEQEATPCIFSDQPLRSLDCTKIALLRCACTPTSKMLSAAQLWPQEEG